MAIAAHSRREDLRFPLEPRKTLGIVRETVWKDLDGVVALERRVMRPPDLAHAAFAKQIADVNHDAGWEMANLNSRW